MTAPPPLPIDAHIEVVREAMRTHRAAVLVAAPGAGKTTRVPPALARDGKVLVLQPRRAAARALARRVALEQGWTPGREVGWHVRFEPHFSAETVVLFATEGILTARLQQDPLLEDVRTVVLDEFHERSVHADLGLALVKQAWLARDDLRVLVMSATLDTGPVARYLGGCPVLHVPGSPHPLDVEYAPRLSLADALARVLDRQPGNVLCFLPGAREIEDAMRAVHTVATRVGARVRPLHGSLPPEAQDAALADGPDRRVVLATNLAETSVTVPGVRAVVDTGVQKVARYDPARGLDTLQLERVTADAADQRAGRAARLGAGLAVRLWEAHDRLRPFREPELARVDLAPVMLAILAWGGSLADFDWFDPPPRFRLDDARAVLQRLGALDASGLTALGRRLARMPVPPRLARLVLEADGHPEACLAAALLSDARMSPTATETTRSDLQPLIEHARRQPQLRRVADAIARGARQAIDDVPVRRGATATPWTVDALCRAVLAGFPDRVAQRRAASSDQLLLATGTGARLGPTSGVRDAEYLVALEVRGVDGREPLVPVASAVDRAWLTPTHVERRAWVDESGRLRAARVHRYDALVLQEHHEAPDSDDHAALAVAWQARPRSAADAQLIARLTFCGHAVDLDALAHTAASRAGSLQEMDLEGALPWDLRQELATHAPLRLALPSGRTTALTYEEDGTIRASVKLQELFGLAETPRVGRTAVPVLLELLAPNGRPVQTTRDLRSFWTSTYSEVRKELRGRYPRHPWPEDPWTATPTHRTTRARR